MNVELYKKMLKGECTSEEADQVLKWLQENPSAVEAAMLEEMRKQEPQAMPPVVRQQIMQWFAEKGVAASAEAPVITMVAGRPVKRKWYSWAGAAAAILVLVAIGWLVYPSLKPKAPSMAWVEFHNAGTAMRLLTLPDSTKVWLNAQATLHYREDFNRHEQREVQLSGEGYFKVAHRETHPFVVQTGQLRTQVLGTEFNVEAYADEPFIKVILQKGRVQVSSPVGKDSIREVLLPGQMALYTKSSSRLQVKSNPVINADAWTMDGVVLSDMPLVDALRRIARKFNVTIDFDAAKASRHQHITASYQRMDIEQVLNQLGFTCGFSARKKDQGYRIVWE